MLTTLDRLDVQSKTVLVTGGSKGIGRATAENFAALGARVMITYRHDAAATSLKNWAASGGFDVATVKCDGADAASYPALAAAVRSWTDSLDVLVNNVGGVVRRSSFAESDDDLWREAFDLNLLSAVRATRALLPLLAQSANAVVINVSSIAAATGGPGDSLHYGAAKAALDVFTRGLAKELKGHGIRVVGVAPSAIDTEFQRQHSSPERLKRIISETPVGRIGVANEVADTIVFLAASTGGFINGCTVMITGGR